MGRAIKVRVGAVSPTGFILGQTRPVAANSGIAASGLTTNDLAVISGDQALRDADFGTNPAKPSEGLIQGKYFKGFPQVTPSSRELRFANCYFEGRTFNYTPGVDQPPASGLAWTNGTANPVHFEFCTARAIQPSYGLDGFGGSALGTVYRCDVSRVEDGLYYVGYPGQTPWVKVHGSYVHDLTFWNNDPQRAADNPPGFTHNDGLQCTGSDNGEIIGNNLQAFIDPTSGTPSSQTALYPNGAANSACMLTISAGPHQNLSILNNWLAGGIAGAVQMPYQAKPYESANSWDVSGNRFDPSMNPAGSAPNYHYTFVYCGLTMGPALTDMHDNLFDSLGVTVPPGLGGAPANETVTVGTGTTGKMSLRYTSATRLVGT